MSSLPRTAIRSSRFSRHQLPTRVRNNIRLQSASSSSSTSSNSSSHAVLGGLAGGSLVFLGGYAWYHFSGAKTVISTASATKSHFESMIKKTKASAPAPNETISWLRETALSYAAIIPGAKGYVNSAFDDLESVHSKHRDEVDGIVKEAYDELKGLSEKGFSLTSMAEGWEILQKHLGRIAELAKDASGDVLNNHPELRERFGGDFARLKDMAESYGPEAKREVEETWEKMTDAVKGGFSLDTANRINEIVEETMQKVQRIGEEAWKKGMEQAKPYLEKSPKLKEVIEKNKSKLIKGNATELVQKIKDASSSGKVGDLEKYVQDTVKKSTSSGSGGDGGGLEKYFNMIPSGGSIWSSLSQLQEGAQKHGKEAEKLLKEAAEEIQQVLAKKAEEGRKLAEKASDDVKK